MFAAEYTVVEEIVEPESMKMRLIRCTKTKNLAIQSWGSMQGEWITTQRYSDVQSMWDKSKALANTIVNGR